MFFKFLLFLFFFSEITKIFQGYLDPKVDMFASPGNKKLPLWVGRFPHHGALGCNALEMPLDLPEMQGGICLPPLVHNKPMATEAKGKPHLRVPSSSAPMGWMYMVAPTNQAAKQAMPSFGYSPQVGPFHQLPGREDATYKVAPPLSGFIRKMLQTKQVSAENITLYLTDIRSLDRYDKAFRTLWASIVTGGDPATL